MTSDQAAQMIAQQQQLIDLYNQIAPMLNSLLHDVFPAVAVGVALWLGITCGRVAV